MKNVIWLDLETTGLDEKRHSILSVGAIHYDDSWTNRQEFVGHVHVPKPEALNWSPIALEMHKKSGLYEAIQHNMGTGVMTVPLMQLDVDLAAWINRLVDKPAILAGNSIHFDRKFIEAQMPITATQLHYRMIDVSGMGEACKIFGGMNIPRPEYPHRSLGDTELSIKYLQNIMGYFKGKNGNGGN